MGLKYIMVILTERRKEQVYFCAPIATNMPVIMLQKRINRRIWLTGTASSPSIPDPMFAVASGYSITKQCVPSDTLADLSPNNK